MAFLMPLLFVFSGAAALICEVVWSRYLALVFGSPIQAQTIVLSVFMCGLAFGNWLFGRRADLLWRPVAIYGLLELLIGVYSVLFPFIYVAADTAFIQAGSGLLENETKLLLLKGGLSAVLLLFPTVLMGGTLPILSGWLEKISSDGGKRSAAFYALNTFGAVAGAFLAGFVLVRDFGLPGTLRLAGAINIVIGLMAIAVGMRPVAVEKSPAAGQSPEGKTTLLESENFKVAAAMVFLSGLISMGLEVLASRTLSLIFGSSLQAFAIMLVAFIFGIALGSAVVASLRRSKWLNENTVVFLLVGVAAMIGIFLLSIEQWSLWYLKIRNAAESQDRYTRHLFVSSVASILVIGLPAACVGGVLPLCIRLVAGNSDTFGGRVGRLLACNTCGAVLGALFLGFIAMPILGLRLAFGLVGALAGLGAMLVAWRGKWANGMLASGFAAAAVLAISMNGRTNWQLALSSGIFRVRDKDVSEKYFVDVRQRDELVFYKDGADATVSVVTDREKRKDSELVLAINGKSDASTLGDLSTQYLLAHLPMMMRPYSTDVFILGFGSGITAGALLGHPVRSITIAENCRPVLEAAPIFAEFNRGVLTNRLTKIYREDARTVLKLLSQRYDIIISQPSNPWVSGMSSVFTREFYELAASRISDEGIFAQWFHVYESNDEIFEMMLRTFRSVFPSVEIWEPRHGDLLLLGSKKPWPCTPKIFAEAFQRPKVQSDMDRIGIKAPEALLACQMASQETSFAFAPDGPLHSDYQPALEYSAQEAFYRGEFVYKIFVYDERLLQSAFAPKEKRDVLVALSDEMLAPIFLGYSSANSPLVQYIDWRAQVSGFMNRVHQVYDVAPFLDIIFRPSDTFPREAAVPPGATPTLSRFLESEALLHQPGRWKEGIELVKQLLQNFDPQSKSIEEKWKPSHFAAVAAKTQFTHGDVAGAREMIDLGLKIEPDDFQLVYIKRLIDGKQQRPGKS